MSQSDFGVIDPATKSGTILASDLSNARTAWVTQHRGTSRPPYATSGVYGGMMWIDDTTAGTWIFKVWDGAVDTTIWTVSGIGVLGVVDFGALSSITVTGTAGNTGTASVDANTGTFISNSVAGVSIISSDSTIASLYLGGQTVENSARLRFNNSTNLLELSTNIAGGQIGVNTADGVPAIRIDSSQRIGIGTTSPNANSKVHIQLNNTATTFDTGADDFIVEGNGNTGMSVISNNAGVSQYFCGSTSAPKGAGMSWSHGSTLGSFGTYFAGADLQLKYKLGIVGIHIDGGTDKLGFFNSTPQNEYTFGSQAMDTAFSSLVGTQQISVVATCQLNASGDPNDPLVAGTKFSRNYFEGYEASGINIVASGAKTDQKLICFNLRGRGSAYPTTDPVVAKNQADSIFDICVFSDDLSTHTELISWELSSADKGRCTIPHLAGASSGRAVIVDSNGVLSAP